MIKYIRFYLVFFLAVWMIKLLIFGPATDYSIIANRVKVSVILIIVSLLFSGVTFVLNRKGIIDINRFMKF